MKTVGFCLNVLCERGVSVAVFDYAYYNQTLLDNKSIIFAKSTEPHVPEVLAKFLAHFRVHLFSNIEELHRHIHQEKIDVFYNIKYGHKDGIYPPFGVKHAVHTVFDTTSEHGNIYATISDTLNIKCNTHYPVVPHMINLPDVEGNWRNKLSIPDDAIVFGRYGGYEQFDNPIVHQAIKHVLDERENIYFIFSNTKIFHQHPRIIYLPKMIDLDEKVQFIQTCNAHIHGRLDGETFGLTIGEFSVKGVPTIMSKIGWGEHVRKVGNKGIYFDDVDSCVRKMLEFTPVSNYRDSYCDYTPPMVMDTFKRIFYDSQIVRHQEYIFQVYSNDLVAQNLIRGESWEPHLTAFSRIFLNTYDVVIDIGANFGYHTIAFSKMVPNGAVLAFEPQWESFQILTTNVGLNRCDNVVLFNQAIGNINKNVIVPQINTSVVGNMGDISVDCSLEGREVPCTTLDRLNISRVNYIKIDVQGYELFVLRGAEETLLKHFPVIAIELEDHQLKKFGLKSKDVVDYLVNLGYYIYYLDYRYPSDHIAVHITNKSEFEKTFGQFIMKNDTSNDINRNTKLGITEKIVLKY